MYRFLLLFVLTLGLFFGYQTIRSLPTLPPDDAIQPQAQLTARTVPDLSPFVWWEAEEPNATNFPTQNPFAPANEQEARILSGGKWVGTEGKRNKTLFLEYRVNVPVSGEYQFYSRKFWKHGPFRWQWDRETTGEVKRNPYLLDSVGMRLHVSANWIRVGAVNLTQGEHRLRIELTENEGAAAFDCFLLTQKPFQPRGQLRPNERYAVDLPGWFVFDPEQDSYQKSPIDLRYLNERFAGEQGYIQVKGEDFIHTTTQAPVRFWAVNVGEDALWMDASQRAEMAKFLAKRGVNLVRFHGKLWDRDFRQVDLERRDRLFSLIAALKQEGIYTSLSIYFPLWLKLNKTDGFGEYNEQHPFGLLFFNREFQEIYWGWWRSLLTTPNPATGKTLATDPAVAMVELVNEDSLLFWTFEPYKAIPAAQMEILERQFGTWLTEKYGALTTAFSAWSTAADSVSGGRQAVPTIRGDALAENRVGILPLAEILSQSASRRAQDTVAFLTETQTQFFAQGVQTLRETLGYGGLIYGSNWKTADARLLDPLDKYSNRVGDFFDRHGYFDSSHQGERASFSLNTQDTYQDRSALHFTNRNGEQQRDFQNPLADLQYDGKPSTISEVNWSMPNRFRAEFPVLAAAYGQLQGTDGIFFFATQQQNWEPSLGKFAIAHPSILGQFPATALIYRQGLLKPGAPAADITLNVEDLLALQGSPVAAGQNLDALRSRGLPFIGNSSDDSVKDSFDPRSFWIGKVRVRFQETSEPGARSQGARSQEPRSQEVKNSPAPRTPNPAPRTPTPQLPNLPTPHTILSNTHELLWNYNSGFVTLNAPKAQGITGFLRQAGVVDLADMRLTSEMTYGSVLLVPLDGRAIAQSHRLLLQVMSEDQNLGWRTQGFPERRIESVGNPPIVVRNLAGQVTLKRGDAAQLKVTALDANGYPMRTVGMGDRFSLLPDVFYYVLEEAKAK